MHNKIWEILTTLTEEAQKSAINKCIELGFDRNRGIVPIDESFINLSSARSILMGAIEKNKLIQLPITVQQLILNHLEAISNYQTNLINGSDQVVNLAAAIEQLNTVIWQFGLHNLSNEVLGYQTKLNQIKQQELKAKKLIDVLNEGLQLKTELDSLVKTMNKSSESILSILNTAEQNNKSIVDNVSKITELEHKSAASYAITQQNEINTTKLLSSTSSYTAEVKAVEVKIKEFFAQIDAYKTDILTTRDTATNAINNNKAETDAIITRLKILEDQIKDQLQKATGYSLFHSFQTRQANLVESKNFWIYALGIMVTISLALSVYIMMSTTNVDVAFYMKLSMSLPLVFAITFCTVQYSRERKLEEEYAFKSNISLSLIPYQELVEKLINTQSQSEKDKYAAFLIDSINKVFTSPTDKVFDGDDKKSILNEKNIKLLSKLIDPLVKIAKPH